MPAAPGAVANAPLRLTPPAEPVTRPAAPAAARPPMAVDRALFTQPTTRNAVALQVTNAEAKAALLGAIARAKGSFYVETFEWHDDAAGNEVIAALAARIQRARREGKPFDAKVLIDYQGMRGRPGDAGVVAKLKAAGVDVHVFNRGFGVLADGKLAPLTHRKLYIQDGDAFITGGRNVGDEYLGAAYRGPDGVRRTAWHDLSVTITGAETARAVASFYQDWRHAGGHVPDQAPVTHAVDAGQARVQSFGTDPDRQIFSIRRAHARMIAGAQREIFLAVPYLSDDTLIDQLIAAKRARPQLAIKVLLPGVEEPSQAGRVFKRLNADSALKLTAAGIEVRLFGGGHEDGRALARFSHLKGLMVDGRLLSVGSANGDDRTYAHNRELIAVIDDPATVGRFQAKVAGPDWRDARPFDRVQDGQAANEGGAAIYKFFKGLL